MPAPISVGSRSQLSSGWVALLAAALTSLAACSGTGSEPFAHSDAIDSIAAAALEEGPILGLSIGVAHNGHVVFEAGYGVTNIDATSPATGHTIYNIASTAKILAAAAVVKLAESGQLDLDDRLESLLPDVPNRESVGKITVRQLLNMTSGLNDYVGADVKRLETSDEPLDPSFVLDHVQQNPLDFEPGTNWIYSNTGFYLAGLIVERISGRAWGSTS